MPDIKEWEQEEVLRSASEAQKISDDLLADANNVARYIDPPPDTPYPLEYAFHVMGDVREKRVLDFGCGSGINTILLASRGADVVGLDISPDLIEIARRRMQVNGKNAQFVVGSAYSTGLPDESIDVVFCIAILHHLDLELCRRELWRVLKKGGICILHEPVRDSAVLSFLRRLIPYQHPDVSPFERPLTTEELKTFSAGFQVFDLRKFCLPIVGLTSVVAPKLIHNAFRLDRALLRRFKLLRRYAAVHVIKLVKPRTN